MSNKPELHQGELLCLVERPQEPGVRKLQWVEPEVMKVGLMQHTAKYYGALTPRQVNRIERLQKSLSEVDPSTIDKWIDNFMRDWHPERELIVWEGIEKAYTAYCSSHNLGFEGRVEVFKVVLFFSNAGEKSRVLKELKLKVISREDAIEIMDLYYF